jgi:hypothetical protein
MEWISGESLGRYRVEKSFAGGGFYGASTGVEDVEYGFAKSVADVILQPSEAPAGS